MSGTVLGADSGDVILGEPCQVGTVLNAALKRNRPGHRGYVIRLSHPGLRVKPRPP